MPSLALQKPTPTSARHRGRAYNHLSVHRRIYKADWSLHRDPIASSEFPTTIIPRLHALGKRGIDTTHSKALTLIYGLLLIRRQATSI
ncbi:hypothetical protein BV20DRAFT_975624 [Pilatotrama ljubarskyi]|nr:hypothetical protein BV20DRAFT_975624 [Pilatotrama ljubarskyi]